MKTTSVLSAGAVAIGIALVLSASQASIDAGQATGDTVPVDADDIGGVVTGPNGPEAGVWVIAETTDLPTKFIKIVVTDDRGRYLVPDLPDGDLQRVGPRLWAGRFAEGDRRRPARR